MASTGLPNKMHLTPDNTGLWHIKQTDDAAKTTSELLQKDMEVSPPLLTLTHTTLYTPTNTQLQNHHVFFNKDGFHNHVRPPRP